MYTTTSNPHQQVQAYWSGSELDTCPDGVDRYTFNWLSTISKGHVTSWRGKKDLQQCREFDRFQFDVTGPSSLWYCNKGRPDKNWQYKGVDGGSYYVLGKLTNPTRDYSLINFPSLLPDQFMIGDKEVGYRNYVVSELFAKANEGAFNAATFLAELGESVYWIRDLLKQFVRITKFTKGVIKRGANPDEAWLEWRYAVQPLMLTIEDVLSLIYDKARPKDKVQNYTDFGRVTESFSWDQEYDYGILAHRAKITTHIRVGCGLHVVSQNDPHPYGTGLHDIVLAGWEVTKASFIYDWFIGVGTWLESFRNTNLICDRRYATLVKEKCITVWIDESACTCVDQWIMGPTQDIPVRAAGRHITRIIDDDVCPTIHPQLVPGKLSLLHKLDGLALILSSLKGLRR